MESELLALRAEIAELRQTIMQLTERTEKLEAREASSGIYIDGVSDGYRKYIQEKLERK